jgi:hypothetical protein
MSGGYSFEGGVLEAPELVSTLKFCTGVPGEVEAAFTQELATGFEVTGGGNVLVLRGDAGTDFRYERTVTMTGDDEDNEEDDDEGSEEDDDEGDEGEDRSVSGIVVSVNLDAIAFDGPAVVTVRTETEGNVEVNVPSFGINLCAAASSIADVYLLKAGDQVEVRGAVSEEGAIVPCESSEHYLRVVED